MYAKFVVEKKRSEIGNSNWNIWLCDSTLRLSFFFFLPPK